MEQNILEEYGEMISVLKRVNNEREEPLGPQIIPQILALVIKNPLDSDRSKCQNQIREIIKQRRR